jgi:hypothetical protein
MQRWQQGQIVTRWLLKLLVGLGAGAVVLFEGGSVVVTRVQAQDLAQQAAEQAGCTSLGPLSPEAARDQAQRYVEQNHATFLGASVDQASNRISVSIEKVAPSLLLRRFASTRRWTQVRATGSAPTKC